MLAFDRRDKARKGFEACLRSLREVASRFPESRARAVGYFLEGPSDPFHTAFYSPDAAADFLRLPTPRVLMAQPLRVYPGSGDDGNGLRG